MGEENRIANEQYLTFKLAGEEFAVEISRVREVLDYTNITEIPRTPDFMCGVINLRGNVVPILDLRLKLGIPKNDQMIDTCIVIMEIDYDGDMIQIGALADSVQEVVNFEADQIGPAPKLGTRLNARFIKGIAKYNERFLIIIATDNLLSASDMNKEGVFVDSQSEEGSELHPA